MGSLWQQEEKDLKLYLKGKEVTQTILKWFSWDLTYYSIHAVLMSWCTLKLQLSLGHK